MAYKIEKIDNSDIFLLAFEFEKAKEFLTSELTERFGVDVGGTIDTCNTRDSIDSIANKIFWYGDILCVKNSKNILPYFCRAVFENPFFVYFDSVSDAAAALKSVHRNWMSYQFQFFRRAALVSEKLPYVNMRAKKFPFEIPQSPMGIFTLIDEHKILAGTLPHRFLLLGQSTFIEDHINPPSRAYLKLWEALVMMHDFWQIDFPQKGEKCFDAGACPGGWTWALTEMGCNVLAVDRAPLAEHLIQNKLVTFKKHDAFTIEPTEVGACDWVLSDVICYPSRLLEWVEKWLASGLVRRMICTIKMQGKIDWQIVQKFADIDNSCVLHLNYNKHELCWLYRGEK